MASNPYVNKVQLADGTSVLDISDTTAVASDVASGKYFYLATGQKVQGSASGGTAAISVVDTTDTAGGTIRTITALDISDTTAVASDVASGKYFYTANGVKTAGTASGGGGSSYQFVTSGEITANTSSTTTIALSSTITAGSSIYTSNKIIYVKIRNKSGATNNYHYGNDCYVITSPSTISDGQNSEAVGNVCYYVSSNNVKGYGPLNYGVSVASITSNGVINFQARYNSSYTKTINGTYEVSVYLLDYENNESPF